MSLKSNLIKLYNWPFLSKEETNKNQIVIRDTEWNAINLYIKKGVFLDVGCGAGYAMKKALQEGNKPFGIDPEPGAHGVGRHGSNYAIENIEIKQAFAEQIPFEDAFFDTVYSSHVLEHVNDEQKSLSEMKRVLKDDGILIIGMPTNHMAFQNLIINTLLTLHQRLFNFFFSPFFNTAKISFRELFIPPSHSFRNKTVFYDLKKYKIENWQAIVSQQFKVEVIVKPAYYIYPECVQFFKLQKKSRFTSSVFFICRKK